MKNDELKQVCNNAISSLNSMEDWTDDYDLKKDLQNTAFEVNEVIHSLWNALVDAGVCKGELADD